MKSKRTGLIIGGILAVLVVYLVLTYNSLVSKEEQVKRQWAEVQNTYQRRIDLIPNLVNVVKGVSDFEQSTLTAISEARARALSGQSSASLTAENYNELSAAQDNLASATNRLILVVEKYPVLKGTQAYSGLQTQLEGTERRIKVARNDFNAAIADYNRSVRSFPTNLAAGIFGFKSKDGFAAAAGTEQAVEIKF